MNIIDLTEVDLTDKTNNLLLNMMGGLLPEDLSSDEISLLRKRFGDDWFHKLGYSEEAGFIYPGIDNIE